MDNQPQPTDRDEEIEKLHTQLAEVVAAEKFPLTDSGRLWLEIATKEINKAIRDITSDKYDKDHNGYLARKSDLNCYKNMVKQMQLAASPVRKQKILDALPEESNGPVV